MDEITQNYKHKTEDWISKNLENAIIFNDSKFEEVKKWLLDISSDKRKIAGATIAFLTFKFKQKHLKGYYPEKEDIHTLNCNFRIELAEVLREYSQGLFDCA